MNSIFKKDMVFNYILMSVKNSIFIILFLVSTTTIAQLYPEANDIIESTIKLNENGKLHGNGMVEWFSGDIYEGTIKDGNFSGTGKMSWHTGESYMGEWKNDFMHGYGKLIWNNGYIYEGFWKYDKMHGEGILIFPDGTKEKGIWNQGELIEAF